MVCPGRERSLTCKEIVTTVVINFKQVAFSTLSPVVVCVA